MAGDVLALELADGRSVQIVALPMQTENLDQDPLRPLGLVRYEPQIEPIIGTVLLDGAAARAGFQPGDRLIAANGETVASWQEWVRLVRAHPSQALRIEYVRQGQH